MFTGMESWCSVAESWQLEARERSHPLWPWGIAQYIRSPRLCPAPSPWSAPQKQAKIVDFIWCRLLLYNLISKKKFGFRTVFFTQALKIKKQKNLLALVLLLWKQWVTEFPRAIRFLLNGGRECNYPAQSSCCAVEFSAVMEELCIHGVWCGSQ